MLHDRHLDAQNPPAYHYYWVDRWQGTPAICNHEHTAIEWFPYAEAAALPNLALPEYRGLFGSLGGFSLPA
jgi:8-oxo-dGTP pyrophosphatase MutT (NUDIX family)